MPGRLRVVFDARSVVAHRSGVGNYTASLLRHMVRLDDQVEWLVLRHPSATEPIAPGSTVTERPFAGETKSVHTVLRLGRAGGFGDRHLYHSPADLIPHRLRCPAVVTIHDLMWVESPELGSAFAPVRLANGWWYRHNIGSAIRRSSAVIAISEATAEAIRRNYPQHARKVRVIHHGLDRRRFHPDRALPRAALDPWIPAGCPYSLIVGQGSPYKNHDGMVRAFLRAMADRPQHRLVMVRRFERIDGAVRRLLAQPEVRSRVHPLPHVSDELLCTLYRHARMLLSASHCEGFGMPVLEAMSMGTVVLTSTAPALLEVTGEAAVHVDATDEEALASAIRRLDDDSALRQRLARAGRHQARRFSWQRAAELTLASYREAVGLGAEGGNRTPDTARMNLGQTSQTLAEPRKLVAAVGQSGALQPVSDPCCLNSLPKLRGQSDAAGVWLRSPPRPLAELAAQVIKSIEQRSRLVRRHARQLAEGVLQAPERVDLANDQAPVDGLGDAARAEHGAARHWIEAAASLAVFVAANRTTVEGLIAEA